MILISEMAAISNYLINWSISAIYEFFKKMLINLSTKGSAPLTILCSYKRSSLLFVDIPFYR